MRAQSLLKQTNFRAGGSLFENTSPGLLCPTSLLLRLRKVRTNRLSTFFRHRPLLEKSYCLPQLPLAFALEDSLLTQPVES